MAVKMMIKYKIYMVKNLINKKNYIGQTIKSNGAYKNYLGSGHAIKSAIIKYGKKNFQKVTLAICYNQNDANELEKYFINSYNSKSPNGYNISDGGTESVVKMRENLKERMSGDKNPFFGKTHSDETKRKLSEINKGKKVSKDVAKKISQANKGMVPWNKGKSYPHTPEQKRKIAEANKNRGMTPEMRKNTSERMKLNNPMSDPKIAKKANCFRNICHH